MANKFPTNSTANPQGRYVKGGTTSKFSKRLGWWERKILTPKNDDIVITISDKYHQRPDLVAHDAYGRVTLTWLVLQYNTILDVNTEFVVGNTIRIPSPKRVLFEFT